MQRLPAQCRVIVRDGKLVYQHLHQASVEERDNPVVVLSHVHKGLQEEGQVVCLVGLIELR